MGLIKSLMSLKLELTAQGVAEHTDVQSRVWYHSAIQVPISGFILSLAVARASRLGLNNEIEKIKQHL